LVTVISVMRHAIPAREEVRSDAPLRLSVAVFAIPLVNLPEWVLGADASAIEQAAGKARFPGWFDDGLASAADKPI
jgi:hypothetical protein